MTETDEQFVERMRGYLLANIEPDDAGRVLALARRGAEAVKMMAEQDYKYNQNTNDLIARHAGKMKEAAARIEQLEEALRFYADGHPVTGNRARAALGGGDD